MNCIIKSLIVLLLVSLIFLLVNCSPIIQQVTVVPTLELAPSIPIERDVVSDPTLTSVPPTSEPLTHEPYDISMVTCPAMDRVLPEPRSNWADVLVPGESDLEEFEALSGEAHGANLDATQSGQIRHRGIVLAFRDGILVRKIEIAQSLGDIRARYGEPVQFGWQLPKRAFHLATYRTFLLYPSEGAIFYTDRQIVDFENDVIFEYSIIVAPSEYQKLLAQFSSDESAHSYQFYNWPCFGS